MKNKRTTIHDPFEPIPEVTNYQCWPRLFECWTEEGKKRAGLSRELSERKHSLITREDIIELRENDRFHTVHQNAVALIVQAKAETGEYVAQPIAELFLWVWEPESLAEREQRAAEAKRIMCSSIDCIAGNIEEAIHASKQTVVMADYDKPVVVAVAAIEHARQLVETHQKLPTKIEIQRTMEDAFPELLKLSQSAWPKIWKDAGLSGLPKGSYGTGNVQPSSR